MPKKIAKIIFSYFSILGLLLILCAPAASAIEDQAVPFVVQLTRTSDNHGHRRAFLQIDKMLDDIGEKKLKIEVVAYEDGIHALLANNKKTSQLLTKLAHRGVIFKACRISMRAWGLKEDEFSLEAEFIPAGAPEVIRLQMQGYKYFRP